MDAVVELLEEGATRVPDYDISTSSVRGHSTVALEPGGVIVAEGIFAERMPAALDRAGVRYAAWYIDQARTTTAARRFVRDVAERRKPVPFLVQRGGPCTGRTRRAGRRPWRPASPRDASGRSSRISRPDGPPAASPCPQPEVRAPRTASCSATTSIPAAAAHAVYSSRRAAANAGTLTPGRTSSAAPAVRGSMSRPSSR